MSSFHGKSHQKYFQYFLNLLPTRLESQDSSKLLLLYFTVCGLRLLDYEFTEELRMEIIEFVYLHLVDDIGFRGSLSHCLPKSKGANAYDPPTLAATYSALCILQSLKDDFSRVPKHKIIEQVKSCQGKNGCFSSYIGIDGLPLGDGDLRQCYLAASIRKFLNVADDDDDDEGFDLKRLERYVLDQVQYDGGLGTNESHAGLTFCGIATLKLIDSDSLKSEDAVMKNWSKTIEWLVHRQISFNEFNFKLLEYEFMDESDEGSFNGRANKFGDTCYSFWVLGSLKILTHDTSFINRQEAIEYLLNVTQSKRGGFGKSDIDDPDPFHTYLGLCALSLLNENDLKIGELDEVLVIPTKA